MRLHCTAGGRGEPRLAMKPSRKRHVCGGGRCSLNPREELPPSSNLRPRCSTPPSLPRPFNAPPCSARSVQSCYTRPFRDCLHSFPSPLPVPRRVRLLCDYPSPFLAPSTFQDLSTSRSYPADFVEEQSRSQENRLSTEYTITIYQGSLLCDRTRTWSIPDLHFH